MIYLDNAATSFPKPAACFERALAAYLKQGASPGRGGYDLASQSQEAVTRVRDQVAAFFRAPPGSHTCFAYNATDALNTLLQGLARPGCHMVSTRLEHNSVLRPLHHLREQGRFTFDLAPFNQSGQVEPWAVAKLLRPETALVIMTHASNVLGSVQPVADIGRLCMERGVPLILDVSQSAGQIPIDMESWGVAGLAFTGHKSLLGPTGIGGLVISPSLPVEPSRFGGTGVDSASLRHSPELPARLEAGTLNLLGILTLGQCLDYLQSPEAKAARIREQQLFIRLQEGLAEMDGVTLYGPGPGSGEQLPCLSCNLKGWSPDDAGMVLDGDFDLAVRTGLHCAPLAHQDLGTGRSGAVRFSLSPFNRETDIEAALSAMAVMARRKQGQTK